MTTPSVQTPIKIDPALLLVPGDHKSFKLLFKESKRTRSHAFIQHNLDRDVYMVKGNKSSLRSQLEVSRGLFYWRNLSKIRVEVVFFSWDI